MRYSSVILVGMLPFSAFASPCDYEKDVSSMHLKKIESTKVIDKSLKMVYDNQMKCDVSIESLVEKKWYKQNESFIFNPFTMNAEEGCDRAVKRAKERIYHRASPELFKSTTNMKCNYKSEKEIRTFAVPLPKKMIGYGETIEIKINPKCKLVAGTIQYDEGYVLYGHREICE